MQETKPEMTDAMVAARDEIQSNLDEESRGGPKKDGAIIAEQIKASFSDRGPKKGDVFKMRDGVEYVVMPSGSYKRLTPKKGSKKHGKH